MRDPESTSTPKRPQEGAVLEALSDQETLRILTALDACGASVRDLAERLGIPLATCYRRIHRLQRGGLVYVERSAFTPDGKRYEVYRTTFRRATVTLEAGAVRVTCDLDAQAEQRLSRAAFCVPDAWEKA